MTDVHPDVEVQPAVIEDSDDDFQYEEVEVVRYEVQALLLTFALNNPFFLTRKAWLQCG